MSKRNFRAKQIKAFLFSKSIEMHQMQTIPSPKLGLREKRQSIYPYYAGFSSAFAKAIILRYTSIGSSVFDPWNGSGTTTTAAYELGRLSSGVEINPALVEISKARIADESSARITVALQDLPRPRGSGDSAPLPNAFARHYVELDKLNLSRSRFDEALIRTIFFRAIRAQAGASSTKNPTWFSPKRFSELKCSLETARRQLSIEAEAVHTIISGRSKTPIPKPKIYKQDVIKFRGRTKHDLILTSPPYLTRIDYVLSTLPELSFLHEITNDPGVNALRKSMIGTPLVGTAMLNLSQGQPQIVVDIIKKIERHESKASSGYYRNFFILYFNKLIFALSRITKSLATHGTIAIVVQPSYYKEIFVDLAEVCAHMGGTLGLNLIASEEFRQTRSMASLNARSHLGGESRLPSEVCLIFLKDH